MRHTVKKSFYYLIPAVLMMIYSCGKPDPSVSDDLKNHFCIPDSLMQNITLDTVKSEFVTDGILLSGKITFDEDNVVKIFPVVSGHVSEVRVSLGDFVEKGQLLATIRSSDMANYFNEYKSAESELAIAKKNMDVTAEMKSSGVSSERDLTNAQNEYQKALAQFNKVSEVLKIYGSSVQQGDSIGSVYLIKSPISGFIVEKNVTSGMELRPDQGNQLFTISDLKKVWAIANVYETDISKIQTGSEVEVSTLSYPDKKIKGKVERVSNILDPETNVMNVKISLANDDYLLKPGMFARITVMFPRNKKMLVVPSSTIIFDDNKNYVVKFQKRCDVSMQEVHVSKTYGDKSYFECDSLLEGDRIIVENGLFVFTALKKL